MFISQEFSFAMAVLESYSYFEIVPSLELTIVLRKINQMTKNFKHFPLRQHVVQGRFYVGSPYAYENAKSLRPLSRWRRYYIVPISLSALGTVLPQGWNPREWASSPI